MHAPLGMPHAMSEMGVHMPLAPQELLSQMQPMMLSQTECAPHTGPPLHTHLPLMQAFPVGVQSAQAAPPVPHWLTVVLFRHVAPLQQPIGHDLPVQLH